MGNIRDKLDKIDFAISDHIKVISIDPLHAASYHSLGLIFDKLCKYDEAIKYFDKAIELDHENSIYWHNRGCSYRNVGK